MVNINIIFGIYFTKLKKTVWYWWNNRIVFPEIINYHWTTEKDQQ